MEFTDLKDIKKIIGEFQQDTSSNVGDKRFKYCDPFMQDSGDEDEDEFGEEDEDDFNPYSAFSPSKAGGNFEETKGGPIDMIKEEEDDDDSFFDRKPFELTFRNARQRKKDRISNYNKEV